MSVCRGIGAVPLRHGHTACTCVVPAQSIGYFNSNYNEYVQVSDMAVYQGDESLYKSYPCTYDGKGTFTFYLIYYVSDGFSTYWGGCDFAIGYIGDTLYWLAAPGSAGNVYQYQFLLFNSEQANGNSYTRESVGSKSYSNVKMLPFTVASSASPASSAVE